MAKGRRAVAVDTKPGQVLVLGLLANVPVALAFVVAPMLGRADPRAAADPFVPFVLWGTPVVAAWGAVVFARAPAERRAHRAARIGVLLCAVALLMWALVMIAPGR